MGRSVETQASSHWQVSFTDGFEVIRRFLSIIYVHNSAIHKAAGSLVTSHSLQNGKMSMRNRHTERCPEVVLYGGRPSGGFVNSAVSTRHYTATENSLVNSKFEQALAMVVLIATGTVILRWM